MTNITIQTLRQVEYMSNDLLLDSLMWAYNKEGMPSYDLLRREAERRMRAFTPPAIPANVCRYCFGAEHPSGTMCPQNPAVV